MKKLIALLLLLCAVLSLATPVSAGWNYLLYMEVNATDFTNALVDYCNENTVHNMTECEFELSIYDIKAYGVKRTDDSLEFRFKCKDIYLFFVPFPLPWVYEFEGIMYVNNPQDGLKKPYTLDITNKDRNVRAVGENWTLYMWDTYCTRFYS